LLRIRLDARPPTRERYHEYVFNGDVMSWASAWGWMRVGVLALGVLFLAHHAWDQVTRILAYQPLGIDFLPMWSAAREAFSHPHRVYDFAGLTRFEHPLLGHFHGIRPFVYPPAALLVFLPFSLAPFALANGVWIAIGLLAIVGVTAGKLGSPRTLVLVAMVLTPASVLVVVAGQVTFLIAALAVAGLYALKSRPVLAGALFGVAGAIKPQALVLLPLALLALRDWRALSAAAATVAAAVLVSAAVFGAHAWLDWLAAVPRFQKMVMASPGLERGMITPTALGITLGLAPDTLMIWRVAFGLGAAAMVWLVFHTTDDPARRLSALLGGGLFITPYAMHYDAALLAPAAALMLTQRPHFGPWVAALAASAALCCAAIPHWGAAGVTGFVLWASLIPETAFAKFPAFFGLAAKTGSAPSDMSAMASDR
jgi:hypothetical protein